MNDVIYENTNLRIDAQKWDQWIYFHNLTQDSYAAVKVDTLLEALQAYKANGYKVKPKTVTISEEEYKDIKETLHVATYYAEEAKRLSEETKQRLEALEVK